MKPKTTVAIPLFKSARFIDTIIANIEAISTSNAEILISDRHCYDDTIDRLAERYSGDARIRFFKNTDKLNWVEHINKLLESAQGEYWQFQPHDDINPPGCLDALVTSLDLNDDAILSYGAMEAIDIDGQPTPKRNNLKPHPVEADRGWTLGMVLEMFWKGYFNGAFKGVIRRNVIMDNHLLIRSTRDQILPERCWLFALCLLGRFHFVPDAVYKKRFYQGSVHSLWTITGQHYLSAAKTMTGYLNDFVKSDPARLYGVRDIWLNALRRNRWQDNKVGSKPRYLMAPDPEKDFIRKLPLPIKDFD